MSESATCSRLDQNIACACRSKNNVALRLTLRNVRAGRATILACLEASFRAADVKACIENTYPLLMHSIVIEAAERQV
jgi:hypothetical protein